MSAQHANLVGGNSNPVSQVNSPRFPIEDVSNAINPTTDLQDRVPTYGPWGRDVVVPSINLASLGHEPVHALSRFRASWRSVFERTVIPSGSWGALAQRLAQRFRAHSDSEYAGAAFSSAQ